MRGRSLDVLGKEKTLSIEGVEPLRDLVKKAK